MLALGLSLSVRFSLKDGGGEELWCGHGVTGGTERPNALHPGRWQASRTAPQPADTR